MADDLRLTRTYRRLVKGTNINEKSLLATDYLNHFNEVVMLLEMVPDMPEIIADAAEWKPATYAEHFAASGFSDKELAILAYQNAPREFIEAFEELVEAANILITRAIKILGEMAETASEDELRSRTTSLMGEIKRLLERISAVINGKVYRLNQDQIDDLFST